MIFEVQLTIPISGRMKITLYSMPLCQPCQEMKKFFIDNGIEFTDIDVKADPKSYNHMKKISGQQYVPVVDIDGNLWVVGEPSSGNDRIYSLNGSLIQRIGSPLDPISDIVSAESSSSSEAVTL